MSNTETFFESYEEAEQRWRSARAPHFPLPYQGPSEVYQHIADGY
jgi:phage terminase large subunit-like protein